MPPFDPDFQTYGLLLAYSLAVIVASIAGGMLPGLLRLTDHTRMQLLISFVGGLMLGIAVFHMIPHALLASGGSVGGDDIQSVVWGIMLGLLATFFLLRFFQFHQHGPADFGMHAEESEGESDIAGSSASDEQSETHICTSHNHPSSGHGHAHGHSHGSSPRWLGVLIGLGVHTLMDGLAMAAGVVAEAAHAHEDGVGTLLPGFGIFLAVFLHKPLDAVSITSLMPPSSSPRNRLLVNIGFALMCPVGAFLFLFCASSFGGWATLLATWGLAFSAGVFLCISLSDLLPEMEFHTHSRVPLTIALLLGIAAAWGIGLLEGQHAHAPHGESHAESGDHSHDGHSHGTDSHGFDSHGHSH